MSFDWGRFRDYQLEAISALWQYFQNYEGNPIVAMPTGSGKSWVIAGFVLSVFMYHPRTRVLACTHDEILIKQNLEKLHKVWPEAPAGVYSAGIGRREHLAPITFCGIQSVWNKADLFEHIDILIIDEAHLVSHRDDTMYRKFIAKLKARNPKLKVIGLSATPFRLGLGLLTDGGIFTDICFDYTTVEAYNRLIAAGYLAPLVGRRTDFEIQVDGVGIRGGDYIESELQKATNKTEITQAVVHETIRFAQWENRQRWLFFATGVDHCDAVRDMLHRCCISAVSIHSKSKTRDRDFEAFSAGKVTACVAMNAMTTGVDIPEIDLIAMLRHTCSSSLWVQMLGRGTRPAPWARKTHCSVLDFTTNTARLGPINDPVIPKKPGKKKKSEGGMAPVKVCPQCRIWNPTQVRFCGGFPHPTVSGCGYAFPLAAKIGLESSGLSVMNLGNPEDQITVEEVDIQNITYRVHETRNPEKPNSLMVTYFCMTSEGVKKFREFICFEHVGHPRTIAERWWTERMQGVTAPGVVGVPYTVAEAVALQDFLRIPKKLRVWINKKPHPEIMKYVY